VAPDPAPFFRKFLTPDPGPQQKRRILPESTPDSVRPPIKMHCVVISQENLKKERLETQFEIVKRETNESHVMQYGDQVNELAACDSPDFEALDSQEFCRCI